MRFFKKYNKKGEKIQLRITNYELRIGAKRVNSIQKPCHCGQSEAQQTGVSQFVIRNS
jgi:hypothetical protein